MTNNVLIPFSDPGIREGVSKDLVADDVSPVYAAGDLIWGSLLGKDNEAIKKDALFYSVKVFEHAEKILKDFKANKQNLKKYPRFEESDWEV